MKWIATALACLLLSGGQGAVAAPQSVAMDVSVDRYDGDGVGEEIENPMNVNRRENFRRTAQREAGRDHTGEWLVTLGLLGLTGWFAWRWFVRKPG